MSLTWLTEMLSLTVSVGWENCYTAVNTVNIMAHWKSFRWALVELSSWLSLSAFSYTKSLKF